MIFYARNIIKLTIRPARLAEAHAAADVHDKSDPLGMLLASKGKSLRLAAAHVDRLAAGDTILNGLNARKWICQSANCSCFTWVLCAWG